MKEALEYMQTFITQEKKAVYLCINLELLLVREAITVVEYQQVYERIAKDLGESFTLEEYAGVDNDEKILSEEVRRQARLIWLAEMLKDNDHAVDEAAAYLRDEYEKDS